ncbi:MAG: Gfo/Idh/MocA family oxidoreductase [Chthonomonadales bacterium]|nr:Gfo/Idh/MocA family oxidoreductase [Chthonomonadales bacterium]
MDPAPTTLAEFGIEPAFAMPRRDDWRIGMVGFGSIARHAHAPAYRAMGWPMVAVADPDSGARRAARDLGVSAVYDDYRALIADPRVEVVDLLAQANVREEVVEAAADAGKPLITEKPLARTVAECERMIGRAARAGIALAVHQNYRWMPANYAARALVRAGWVGEPYLVSIQIFGSQDVHLAGHAFYASCDDFLTVQWDNHLADLLRCWTGRNARRVLARTGRMAGQSFASDNLICVLADFGPGLTGHVLHHELLRSSLASQPCRIDGDGGSLVFDLWGTTITLDSVRLEGGPRRIDLAPLGLPPSFAGSMGDFLAAVEEGREPEVSGRRNLATIRTIIAEHASARAGGVWVEVAAG